MAALLVVGYNGGMPYKDPVRQREYYKLRERRKRRRITAEALEVYGGPKCACCGETLVEGLSLDHIGGDGAKHRRDIGPPGSFINLPLWLKRHGWPPGYQVLCMTCNFAKGTKDHCPHQDKKLDTTPVV